MNIFSRNPPSSLMIHSVHTIEKFMEWSQRGYFNGLPFYRVIKHFVCDENNSGVIYPFSLIRNHQVSH